MSTRTMVLVVAWGLYDEFKGLPQVFMNVCSSKQGLGFVGGEALSYSLEVALIGDRYWPWSTP